MAAVRRVAFERRGCNALLGALLAVTIALASANKSNNKMFSPNQVEAVPSFLIIGTAKGGTTDLFEQLIDETVNHAPGRPDPPLPSKASKEPGLLSRGGIDAVNLFPQRPLYFEYLHLLSHPCANASAATLPDCLATNATRQLTIDATPTYFFSAEAPLYLRQLSTLSKVVMMVREPLERAEVLFRHHVLAEGMWVDLNLSINTLAARFFAAVRGQPGGAETLLQRAASCSDLLCQANSWRDLSGLGLMDSLEHKLFMGGLYRYALAVWRYHYFQPGRVMVLDSHVYYERREEVMEEVIRFLYGRSMLPDERQLATSGVVWRKAYVPVSTKMALSPPLRQQLAEFYDLHVMQGIFRMLMEMQDEGAWVMGFDGAPWSECPGFADFNGRVSTSGSTTTTATRSSSSSASRFMRR